MLKFTVVRKGLLRSYSHVQSSSNQRGLLHLQSRAIGTVSKAAPKSLLDEYKHQVSQGVLEYDDRQYHVLRYLNRLCGFMNAPGYKPNPMQTPPRQPAGHQSSSLYKKPAASMSYGPKVIHYTGPASQVQQVPVEPTEPGAEVWAGSNHARAAQDTIYTSTSSSTEPPASSESLSSSEQIMRGVYVYGQVGTGKTLLMDRFYHACTTRRKRRVHFHEFLLEIHQRIRVFKQGLIEQYGRSVQLEKNVSSERDAIEQVALQVADEAWLLCFDEFQVTDVADALILHRFFNVLWNRGVVLVATSNRPPSDLYKNGINRGYFEPFIDRLSQQCIVQDMQTNTDYRSLVQHTQDSYLVVPGLGSELTSVAKSDSLPKYQSNTNTSAVRTQRLWDKFIAVGNDKGEEFSMQTGAAPAAASARTDDDNGSICINTTKKNKVPFAMVVPIMMGRSLVVGAAYPKLPRSQRHSTCRDNGDDDSGGGSDSSSGSSRIEGMDDPPTLSLHHSDRVFGEWPGGVGAGADAVGDASTDASSGSRDKGREGGPVSGSSRGVGWFTFKMLCEEERAAADYQAICSQFDTIFIDCIPSLSVLEHDKARRFIILVDTLYDTCTRVYWAGAAEPNKLFQSMTSADLLAEAGGGQALPLGEASFGTSRQWGGSSDTSAGTGAGVGVGVGVGAAAPIMSRTQSPTSSLGTSYSHKDYRGLQGGGASGSAAGSHTDAEDRNAGGDSGRRVDRDKDQDRRAGLGGPQNMLYGKGAEQQVTTLQITKTQPVHSSSSSSSACASLSDNSEAAAEAGAGAGAGVAPEESTLRILEGELASVQELSFAFRRAASRLQEMAGEAYHERWRVREGR